MVHFHIVKIKIVYETITDWPFELYDCVRIIPYHICLLQPFNTKRNFTLFLWLFSLWNNTQMLVYVAWISPDPSKQLQVYKFFQSHFYSSSVVCRQVSASIRVWGLWTSSQPSQSWYVRSTTTNGEEGNRKNRKKKWPQNKMYEYEK